VSSGRQVPPEVSYFGQFCHNLVERELTHLQYVDDTMLFIVNLEQNIINLKFLCFSFEETSRMKINYDESKVFIVGIAARACGGE
jgi:hypothetical protein